MAGIPPTAGFMGKFLHLTRQRPSMPSGDISRAWHHQQRYLHVVLSSVNHLTCISMTPKNSSARSPLHFRACPAPLFWLSCDLPSAGTQLPFKRLSAATPVQSKTGDFIEKDPDYSWVLFLFGAFSTRLVDSNSLDDSRVLRFLLDSLR
jgi:hypothetical protein